MDILMVNPVHPATPHISATRAWRFAQELSVLGHRVVLLTRPLQSGGPASRSLLATHNWANPFVLECCGAGKVAAAPARGRLRSKLKTVVGLLRHGGSNGQWHDEALRRILDLAATGAFRPDVAWATFGQGEALCVARKAASSIGCPWVMDIKDNWELYIPMGLRRLMAWRVRGWTKLVANAQVTAGYAARWHSADAEIVYSGVDQKFFQPIEYLAQKRPFTINLIGSTYSRELLERFFTGIAKWHSALEAGSDCSVIVNYLGADTDLVQTVGSGILDGLELRCHGYVDVGDLATFCATSSINAYISFSHGFHHKILELLAAGRPIVAFPSEHNESLRLVALYGTPFHITANEDQLTACFDKLFQQHVANDCPLPRVSGLDRHSWPNQARQLESILIAATHKDSP